MSETEAHPWLQFTGTLEDDASYAAFQQVIQDNRASDAFMSEHDAIALEIPARTTETETGCRAETMGVFAEADTRDEALRRLQVRLFQLFVDGALIISPDELAGQ